MYAFPHLLAAVLIGASVGPSLRAADAALPDNVSVGGTFTLKNQVIAAGGKRVSGAAFDLTGTLAQAIAGPSPAANGGNFVLHGGFHNASIPLPEAIFRDGFEN